MKWLYLDVLFHAPLTSRRDRINLFFALESHELEGEWINADDVITFCFYLMNKIHRNLIKIRSSVGWTGFTVFFSYFLMDDVIVLF